MNKKIFVYIAIAALIIFFGVGILISYFNNRILENPPGTVGNTAGNLYNGGLFCENDGYVYFSNTYDNHLLYRMKVDETEVEKIITTPSQSINAAGNHFYYYQANSGSTNGLGSFINTYGIRRASKHDEHTITGIDNSLIDTFILANNALYYQVADIKQNVNYIKKINLDGSDEELIVIPSQATLACVDNSTMYFTNAIENFYLLAMDLNSSNHTMTEVLEEDVYMPIVEGSNLYCIDIHNDYALVHYDLKTKEKTVLDNARTDMLNVADDYIYYQTSGDNPQLKRITKDGSSIVVIADGAYHSIHTTSKYVYFMMFGNDTDVFKVPASGEPVISSFNAARNAVLTNQD